MDKVTKFFGSIPEFFKRNYVLLILALADVAIMAIPFYMDNFIPNMNANFRLAQSDYSQAGAIYGYVSLPCYILGAWLGDKFRAKSMVVLGIVITGVLGVWYVILPFVPLLAGNTDHVLQGTFRNLMVVQLCIIFAGFAFATCALFWAPLWKLVKNVNTEHLPKELQEKQVGKNNGIQGMLNGLIGLAIALFGTLLLELQNHEILGKVGGENGVSIGFLILISLYAGFIILSALLALFLIKEPKLQEPPSFSVKALVSVIKDKTVILLAILVLGVYMLQMGLSSYVNYLKNVFWVPGLAVMLIGLMRTYAMRFMISGWFGKYADKKNSYIPLICIGLLLGMLLVGVGIILPGFGLDNITNDTDPNLKKASTIILQVAAGLNLVVMGAVTWAVVTIRWSPIGTDLRIANEKYAAAVNVVSVIAFTPDAFFKQIRSAIEAKHQMTIIIDGRQSIVADRLGNQLILLVVLGFGLLGLVSGIILHFVLQSRNKWEALESRLQVIESKIKN
ncbi:MFS transporter [Mycoplasma mycoides]|uniref:MFS transporter n=1 Tax=Mycoplasma mycoides TaxID=2102 RepID=UPI00223EDB85|nr:MFS transporter [Mycoplasma mycoides]QVJ95112.1 MFS transporter [Mycoplasma mycoides subsp. capri]